MRRMSLVWAGLVLLILWVVGCGGGGGGAQPIIKSISISPNSPTIQVGGQVGFTATVVGVDNTQVTWSVQPAGGGTITSSGVYTAPSTAGLYTVTAVSVADPSISASVSVTVTKDVPPPPPSCSITVTPTEINQGDEVVVKWTSANAVSLLDSDFGATTVSGQMIMTPPVSREFNLKVLGRDGTIATAVPASVTVRPVKLEGMGQLTSDDFELNDTTYAKVKVFTATKDGDVEVFMKGDGVDPITTPYIFVVKGEATTAAEVSQKLGPYFQYALAQFAGGWGNIAQGYFPAEKGQVYTVVFNTWPINEYGTFSYRIMEIEYKGKNLMTPAQVNLVKKRTQR